MRPDAPWQNIFKICLAQRKLNMSMLEYLDDILEWYSKRNSEQKDEFIASLVAKYGEEEFRSRYEEVLSQLLILNPALVFPLNLSRDQAKLRYRWLIRVFHPDRGVSDTKWLTTCSEIVNISYKDFVECYEARERQAEVLRSEVLAYGVGAMESHPERNSKSTITTSDGIKSIAWLRTGFWRNLLGDPENLQYKIIYSLVSFLVIVLAVILVPVLTDSSKLNNIDVIAPAMQLDGSVQNDLKLAELDGNNLTEVGLEIDQSIDETGESNKEHLSSEVVISGAFLDHQIDGRIDHIQNLPDPDNILQLALLTSSGLEYNNRHQETSYPVGVDHSEFTQVANIAIDNSVYPQPIEKPTLTEDWALKDEAIIQCADPQSSDLIYPSLEAVVDVPNLRLRSGPTVECDNKISLLLGRPIQVLAYSADRSWLYVSVIRKSKHKILGWVSGQYVTLRTDETLNQQAAEFANLGKSKLEDSQVGIVDSILVSADSEELSTHIGELNLDPAMQAVFEEFRDHFKAGDDLQLAGLFINQANENGIQGVANIKRYYRELFSTTENRSLAMRVSKVQDDGYYSAKILGKMRMEYFKGADRHDEWRDFKMLLIKTQKGLKIASLNFG